MDEALQDNQWDEDKQQDLIARKQQGQRATTIAFFLPSLQIEIHILLMG
jgi:predicted nucleic acid-binding Zn ribbon protein